MQNQKSDDRDKAYCNTKTDQDVGFTWMVSNCSWEGESGNERAS